jgi:hypothetical protein
MTFEELLDQAIAMLQRRGRLTYGALKRQFQLDDAYVEDVKAELIEGQRVAVDEDGRVLVWTSGTDERARSTTKLGEYGNSYTHTATRRFRRTSWDVPGSRTSGCTKEVQ